MSLERFKDEFDAEPNAVVKGTTLVASLGVAALVIWLAGSGIVDRINRHNKPPLTNPPSSIGSQRFAPSADQELPKVIFPEPKPTLFPVHGPFG